jgi:hypothetical protein
MYNGKYNDESVEALETTYKTNKETVVALEAKFAAWVINKYRYLKWGDAMSAAHVEMEKT